MYRDETRHTTQRFLHKLNPMIDDKSLLQVKGQLAESNLPSHKANSLQLPGKHHIVSLLIQYHHEAIQHQGRHFTEGAVRLSGLWKIGAKRSIQ